MSAGSQPLHRRFYEGWMAIAGRFAFVQTLVVLSLFYALLIGPWGLGASLLRRDLLDKRHLREPGSAWKPAHSEKPSLERAERPF
jgi:hypothetical protein